MLEVKHRRQRNVLTTGFNLSVWLLEVSAALIFILPSITIWSRTVVVITITGIAPILYILGMSDVRNSLERFHIQFRRVCNGTSNLIDVQQ